jgi:hypothetical protein
MPLPAAVPLFVGDGPIGVQVVVLSAMLTAGLVGNAAIDRAAVIAGNALSRTRGSNSCTTARIRTRLLELDEPSLLADRPTAVFISNPPLSAAPAVRRTSCEWS